MRFKGFIGPSYTLQSINVDCQRCINLYPEIDEEGTGNEGEVAALVSTPGLSLLVTLPTSPVRGVYCDSLGNLWAVGGNTVYQISSSWVATAIGTTFTATGPISFSDNGIEVVIVDGTYGYFWNIAPPLNYAQIIDASFYASNQVTFIDGYLLFNKAGSNEFFFTDLNQVTPFNGLNVGSAESSPDNLVGVINLQENLYLFCQKHFEVWYDSGAASLPFQRIQGAVVEIGCAATQTITAIQTSVYWLGMDKNGQGTVYRVQGLVPQRISTYAVENLIQSLGGSMSSARAWSYSQSGHFFYCLNIPGASTTWVYDTTSELWHERAYLLPGGVYQRHLADCHAFAFNTNVVGDFSSGNLYSLSLNVYSDNGNPLRRERVSPHLSKDLDRVFHSRFYLDMEMGLGLDGTGQGVTPQIMLTWSNDWGHSWSNEHWTSAGPIGARKQRAIWRRLGQARDRVYKVQISDPIKITLMGAEIDVEPGIS